MIMLSNEVDWDRLKTKKIERKVQKLMDLVPFESSKKEDKEEEEVEIKDRQ